MKLLVPIVVLLIQTLVGTASTSPWRPADKSSLSTAVKAWLAESAGAEESYGHINSWDTSLIRDMSSLFEGATSFNEDLSSWDTSAVTIMYRMFYGATAFNGDVSSWDTSAVTDMRYMFRGASAFNRNLSSWDTSSVNTMEAMFFGASSFNGNVSSWDTSAVTDMSLMFFGATSFNGDVGSWNTAAVTDMSVMFKGALSFNRDLSTWDTSAVTNMREMFWGATSFTGDVSNWDMAAVTSMFGMFLGASSFNRSLSRWNTSAVRDMSYVFSGATSFNGDLSSWDTSSVIRMWNMFKGASSFNGDLSSWETSSVTDMSFMFHGALSFNKDLSRWDTSAVTNMYRMFDGATVFNGNISSWDTRQVTSMSEMFKNTYAFDQDISSWRLCSVQLLVRMFCEAKNFSYAESIQASWHIDPWQYGACGVSRHSLTDAEKDECLGLGLTTAAGTTSTSSTTSSSSTTTTSTSYTTRSTESRKSSTSTSFSTVSSESTRTTTDPTGTTEAGEELLCGADFISCSVPCCYDFAVQDAPNPADPACTHSATPTESQFIVNKSRCGFRQSITEDNVTDSVTLVAVPHGAGAAGFYLPFVAPIECACRSPLELHITMPIDVTTRPPVRQEHDENVEAEVQLFPDGNFTESVPVPGPVQERYYFEVVTNKPNDIEVARVVAAPSGDIDSPQGFVLLDLDDCSSRVPSLPLLIHPTEEKGLIRLSLPSFGFQDTTSLSVFFTVRRCEAGSCGVCTDDLERRLLGSGETQSAQPVRFTITSTGHEQVVLPLLDETLTSSSDGPSCSSKVLLMLFACTLWFGIVIDAA